ncbi:hypothetical protein EPI10_004885 [Gossypium australe]|uniref:Uncharacterized protein n=1 Tax=Gossypium australe TaxID=47621 RepID=A0A5B6WLF9_9ROSI|nr:hypothetical protein EPI10_004885 [Gossypium australe]
MISSSVLSKDEGDRLIVSRSTVEAEYRSLAAATSDVTWLLSLLQELHLCSADLPAIWCDNSSAIVLDLFFVREKVTNGSLVVGEVLALIRSLTFSPNLYLFRPLFVFAIFFRFYLSRRWENVKV